MKVAKSDSFGACLGRLVRTKRGVEGLSQDDLSRLTGLAKARISDIENGKVANPQARTVDALCVALDITAKEKTECFASASEPLPNLLLENLALRFGYDGAGSSDWEFEAFLKERARHYRELREKIDSANSKLETSNELLAEAQNALNRGSLSGASEALALAEKNLIKEQTVSVVRSVASIRVSRAITALLEEDVALAVKHFQEASEYMLPFDANEAAFIRANAAVMLLDHSRWSREKWDAARQFWEANVSYHVASNDTQSAADARQSLAYALYGIGEKTFDEEGIEILEQARRISLDALGDLTPEKDGPTWCTAKNTLVATLRLLGDRLGGERGRRLTQQAAAACEELIIFLQGQKDTELLSTALNTLGTVRMTLAEMPNELDEKEAHRAVLAFMNSRTNVRKNKRPFLWANVTSNLGVALEILAEARGGDKKLISEALNTQKKSLSVFTVEDFPTHHAEVMHKLGVLFITKRRLQIGSEKRNLEQAISVFDRAIPIYSQFGMTYQLENCVSLRAAVELDLAALTT